MCMYVPPTAIVDGANSSNENRPYLHHATMALVCKPIADHDVDTSRYCTDAASRGDIGPANEAQLQLHNYLRRNFLAFLIVAVAAE